MKNGILYICVLIILSGGCAEAPLASDSLCVDMEGIAWVEASYPQWLSEEIRDYERMFMRDSKSVTIRVYKGVWHDYTVYFVYNSRSSCMFCDVYYDNGAPVIFPSGEDFCETSHSWGLIYEYRKVFE